jgi:hypothetical protein
MLTNHTIMQLMDPLGSIPNQLIKNNKNTSIITTNRLSQLMVKEKSSFSNRRINIILKSRQNGANSLAFQISLIMLIMTFLPLRVALPLLLIARRSRSLRNLKSKKGEKAINIRLRK